MINCPVCAHPHEDGLSSRLPALAAGLCCSCQYDVDRLVGAYDEWGDLAFNDPDGDHFYEFVPEATVMQFFTRCLMNAAKKPDARRCEATNKYDHRCYRIQRLIENKGLMVCGAHNSQSHVRYGYWMYPNNAVPEDKKINCVEDIGYLKTPADMVLAIKFLLHENYELKRVT
jgi:hypothetical protein